MPGRRLADLGATQAKVNVTMNRRFLVRRLLQTVPLLIGVSVLGFALMHLAPGGPTAPSTRNPNVTAEDIARIKEA